MRLQEAQKGFTIIELMIATAVFGVTLLVITFGMISIGRSYYKGISSSAVQNTVRSAVEDISQSIQFGTGPIYVSPGKLCVGDRLYSYSVGQKLTPSSPQVLLASRVTGGCSSSTPALSLSTVPGGEIQELIGQNMRLSRLSVAQSTTDPSMYSIAVRVIQGDDDLLEDSMDANGNPGSDGVFDTCRGGLGDQYCAASEIRTVVHKRLN